jgi:hypothetical protein
LQRWVASKKVVAKLRESWGLNRKMVGLRSSFLPHTETFQQKKESEDCIQNQGQLLRQVKIDVWTKKKFFLT